MIYVQLQNSNILFSKAQVTLHNDNDTITCMRALIGQKFIVIVPEKKIVRVSDFKFLYRETKILLFLPIIFLPIIGFIACLQFIVYFFNSLIQIANLQS